MHRAGLLPASASSAVHRSGCSIAGRLQSALSQVERHRCHMPEATGRMPAPNTGGKVITTKLDPGARRARVRVPIEEPRDLFGKLLSWYSRRTYGDVLDNGLVLLHHRQALKAVFALENKVAKFNKLDPNLRTLALMASAAAIGCSWCLDFGYYHAHSQGLAVDKLKDVPRWRESAVFSPVERMVIEYAEAMTATPPTVTDEMVAALNEQLGVPAVVELTIMVAIENERSRFNSALGLTSQGFADRCEVPRQ